MVTNDGLLTHIVTGDHQAVANVSALVQYLIALQKKLHEAHSQQKTKDHQFYICCTTVLGRINSLKQDKVYIGIYLDF